MSERFRKQRERLGGTEAPNSTELARHIQKAEEGLRTDVLGLKRRMATVGMTASIAAAFVGLAPATLRSFVDGNEILQQIMKNRPITQLAALGQTIPTIKLWKVQD